MVSDSDFQAAPQTPQERETSGNSLNASIIADDDRNMEKVRSKYYPSIINFKSSAVPLNIVYKSTKFAAATLRNSTINLHSK